MESVVLHTNLKVLVQLKNPRPNETYKLFVFASRDVQNDYAYNVEFLVKNNEWVQHPLLLKKKPTLPEDLQCWLFTQGMDDDQVNVQSLLAWALFPTQELLRPQGLKLQMLDVEHNVQANLHVMMFDHVQDTSEPMTPLNLLSYESQPAQEQLTKQKLQAYQEQVNDIYTNYEHNEDAYFAYVDTPVGRLPVLSFVIMSSQMRQNNQSSIRWFQHLLRLTLVRLETTEAKMLKTPKRWGEVISEMALWQVRCRVYSTDCVRKGKGKLGSDQWTRLGCFPNPELSSGDCEDFAELVLEFLHILKYCRLKPDFELLTALQQHLRRYTPFMVIGQLRIEGGYTCHAYVACMDSRWVETEIDDITHTGNYLPALIIEGTAYTESTWSSETTKVRFQAVQSAKFHNVVFDCEVAKQEREKWARILKYKTAASIVNLEHNYGKAYVLMTADYANPLTRQTEALQLLIKRDNQDKLGLPALGTDHLGFATYDAEIRLIPALRLNAVQVQEINLAIKDMPFSAFPEAPLLSTSWPRLPDPKCTTYSFDMRLIDYKDNRDKVELLFKQFQQAIHAGRDSKIHYTKIAVAKNLCLMNIQIEDDLPY